MTIVTLGSCCDPWVPFPYKDRSPSEQLDADAGDSLHVALKIGLPAKGQRPAYSCDVRFGMAR